MCLCVSKKKDTFDEEIYKDRALWYYYVRVIQSEENMNELSTLQNLIYEIRGQKVMLDSDLAELYDIETSNLNKAVKRNSTRFPPDFMFQLTDIEWDCLKSQFVMSNNLTTQLAISTDDLTFQNGISNKRGGHRTLPYAFTEQGVAMLSSVLNSQRAIDMNTMIIRAFVQMRQLVTRQGASPQTSTLSEIKELKRMLLLHIDNTDNRFDEHGKRIRQIIEVLNNLIAKPPVKRQIGFRTELDE